MNPRERVGVRELRQNLSVYLRAILEGRSFEVTDRGVPVALLAPLPSADTPLSRLVASGRATAPKRDLTQLGLPDGPSSAHLAESLQAQRTGVAHRPGAAGAESDER